MLNLNNIPKISKLVTSIPISLYVAGLTPTFTDLLGNPDVWLEWLVNISEIAFSSFNLLYCELIAVMLLAYVSSVDIQIPVLK